MKRRLTICALAVSAGYIVGVLWTFSHRNPTGTSDSSEVPASEQRNIAGKVSDPRGAALDTVLSELRQPGNHLRSLAELGEAVEQLDSKQFEQIFEMLEHDPARRHDDCPAWLFKRWLKLDPAAAMAWLQPRRDALAQDGPLGYTFGLSARDRIVLAWAEADPEGALDYARTHAQSGLAVQLLWKVMETWRARGDRARVALAADFPTGKARDSVLSHLHKGWATRDPAAAFASARALLQGDTQEQAISDVLVQWAKKDAAAAFAQYKALGLNDSELLSKVIAGSAEQNPMQALGWLQQLGDTQFGQCAPRVVESWARRDPAAALGWALANGVRLSWQTEDIVRIEHNGFERATTTSMVGNSANALFAAFKAKPNETLAWLRALPAGPERDRVLELAVGASQNLDQALQLFGMLPPEGAARVARRMGYYFVNASDRARDWATGLPSGPVRLAALESIGALGITGLELPPGPERDAFLSGSVNRSNSDSSALKPAQKLSIIEQIGNPALRRELLNDIMEQYVDLNFQTKEAAAALDAAKLPEDWKQQWREALMKAK